VAPCENAAVSVPVQPRRRERVLVEQVDDETVLLDLDSGSYFSLNEVGTRVWALCDGSREIDHIVAEIGAEYDADAATIRADVTELLQHFAAERLLAPD
jgi:coenzyme PQQ synthesis protein D (PqqD)